MIKWLLQELEKNPTSLFRKKDLISKSIKQFEELESQGFLTYSQPSQYYETYPCNFTCSDVCSMEVIEMDGKKFAICPQDTEKDPILLTKDDISKYSFSFDILIEAIRKDNGFTGDCYSLPFRLYCLGERVIDDRNTTFIIAFFPDVESAESQLFSLLALVPTIYSQIVVVTPSLDLKQDNIYPKLRAISIFPVMLPSSFGKHDYRINYLSAIRMRLPAGVSIQMPEPDDKQLADCEKYGYKCRYDRLYIPGDPPLNRSNEIFLNGRSVKIGDSLFALLIRFVVELKKGNGGWIESSQLEKERFINDSDEFHPYSYLRTALKGSLKNGDGKEFIEASRSKRFRISTHPDFIKCERIKLLKHHDPDIKALAMRLGSS